MHNLLVWLGFVVTAVVVFYGLRYIGAWLYRKTEPGELAAERNIFVRAMSFAVGLAACVSLSGYVFDGPLLPRGSVRSPDMAMSTSVCFLALSICCYLLTIKPRP
jgi:hypothetical protein